MIQETKSLTPGMFWELYSEKLNESGSYQAYQHCDSWTPVVLGVAEDIISNKLGLKTQREYITVDLVGYTTKWSEEKQEKNWHDRELKVAYEHENQDTWCSELCKLCHFVADLRVISSYYDFRKEKKIDGLLQSNIEKLGIQRMLRVPNSQWLFVFGPFLFGDNGKEKPLRAFTIDSALKVVEITGDKKVVPGEWRN